MPIYHQITWMLTELPRASALLGNALLSLKTGSCRPSQHEGLRSALTAKPYNGLWTICPMQVVVFPQM